MSYNKERLVRLRHLEEMGQKAQRVFAAKYEVEDLRKETIGEDGAVERLEASITAIRAETSQKIKFGHGLKQEGLTVSVNAVDDFSGDNTLPMTAAGVYASVGNIEALLETI